MSDQKYIKTEVTEIKDILKSKRIDRGFTQEKIASELNISRAAYAQYETGKNTPPTEIIIKLAEFYDCSTDYLLGRYTKYEFIHPTSKRKKKNAE